MVKVFLRSALACMMAALMLLPAACGSDDESVPTEVQTSIKGNYIGVVNCVCRLALRDTLRVTSSATVSDDLLTVESLPVAAVVDSVLGKGTATENGISTMPFRMKYKLYNAQQVYYPMSYDPQPISLAVEKEGKTHDLLIYFAGKGSDFTWYYPSHRRIEMALVTSTILLDGEVVTHTATYPDSTQNVSFRFPFVLNKE